jgi:hypothetical protein
MDEAKREWLRREFFPATMAVLRCLPTRYIRHRHGSGNQCRMIYCGERQRK